MSIISHDSVNRIISVEVMVSQPSDSSMVTIYAPPITVPSGTWTVNWDLVVTTEGLLAQFASSGIALLTDCPLPSKVTVVSPPAAVSLHRWSLQLGNDVDDVNTLGYGIGIDWSSAGGTGTALLPAYHDPTIVVVKDPQDPPT